MCRYERPASNWNANSDSGPEGEKRGQIDLVGNLSVHSLMDGSAGIESVLARPVMGESISTAESVSAK